MAAVESLLDRAPDHLRLVAGGGLELVPAEPPHLTVLVVDDDDNDGFLIKSGLARIDPQMRVDLVADCPAARRAVASGKYDAAVVDYRLGSQTGLSLIESLRARGSTLPLILLTGQGGIDVDLDAMRRGASDYLSKNEMTPSMLERSIRYAVRRRADAARLVASQRRYEAAVTGSRDGIWDWDLHSGDFYMSPRFKSMLGFDDARMPSTRAAWLARVHEEDRPAVEEAIADHVAGRTDSLSIEYRVRHHDETWLWMSLRGAVQRDPDGRVERIAGSQSDISERKGAEEEARQRALRDALTGLANRALLFDRLEHAVARARREPGYGFSILYLDIDDFKPINDLQGHAAGDIALVEIAVRLRDLVRGVDCVARVGGDEFVGAAARCRSRRRSRGRQRHRGARRPDRDHARVRDEGGREHRAGW